MKKLLATAAIVGFSSAAQAETVYAIVNNVQPQYETIYQNVPRTECTNVEVPVYGNVQSSGAAEGALLGMILGGVTGKVVTGKDNGAAAGAVIGGLIGADRSQNNNRRVITGYRTERQCNEVLVNERVRQLKNYLITYDWNGVSGSSYTYNNYSVGQRILVEVSIKAK